MGESRQAFIKFCGITGMPLPVRSRSWQNHLKSITVNLSEAARASQSKAVGEIGSMKELAIGRPLAEHEIIDEAVSFDGTWAKRGHSSLFGVQAVIHMKTGKVLDTQVHSKLCSECRRKEECPDVTSDDYLGWKEHHHEYCTKNTDVSSNAMEVGGAKDIWPRSVEKNRMRYVKFIGDGDSKSYTAVKDTYEGMEVTKADCIGHIQKGMGSRLRDCKKGERSCQMGKG